MRKIVVSVDDTNVLTVVLIYCYKGKVIAKCDPQLRASFIGWYAP